ncbi:MAG: hypothetical protein RLZZ539_1167 [Pseudomonadota bacterium]|nr:hypothetical protein [Burkholderiaceae bacterium]
MSSHLIQESRISSQRFYTVMRESKIKFYTTSVAAARYWIKNCSEAPPLHSNGKEAPAAAEVASEEAALPPSAENPEAAPNA